MTEKENRPIDKRHDRANFILKYLLTALLICGFLGVISVSMDLPYFLVMGWANIVLLFLWLLIIIYREWPFH